ncbi:toll/interleukin-1 receptor domain-containing protein [Cyanobium sp. FGCU-6]|nr:toll/interleukin-1 receptor domain-containing protein [Cyanobium sp. FGCU6]
MAGPRSTRNRYDVFLSHSSADKPAVQELAEGLKAAGLRVWLDEWIIKPGDPISVKIEEGLEHSAVLLFCMSAHAFGSDRLGLESHTALFRDPLNRDRRFVPLRLDDAPIKAMLRGIAYLDRRPGAEREGVRQKEWTRLLEACGVMEERKESGGEASGAAERKAAETVEAGSTGSESTRAAESTDATSSLPPPPLAQPPSPASLPGAGRITCTESTARKRRSSSRLCASRSPQAKPASSSPSTVLLINKRPDWRITSTQMASPRLKPT